LTSAAKPTVGSSVFASTSSSLISSSSLLKFRLVAVALRLDAALFGLGGIGVNLCAARAAWWCGIDRPPAGEVLPDAVASSIGSSSLPDAASCGYVKGGAIVLLPLLLPLLLVLSSGVCGPKLVGEHAPPLEVRVPGAGWPNIALGLPKKGAWWCGWLAAAAAAAFNVKEAKSMRGEPV
jgi:hypothetical protein